MKKLVYGTDEMRRHFWNLVDKRGADECWPWKAGRSSKGYGYTTVSQKQIGSHRVAWELANNQIIQPGMCVCHHCDNPICCNPSHLFLGTVDDNIQDKVKKGRSPSREENGRAKLTTEQVLKIRSLHAQGVSLRKLAKMFGVCQNNIFVIVSQETWRSV